MNLWVRTLRQLVVASVALFFFSCEDESSLLGFKNPNKKFHVGYVEIPLDASRVLTIDSIITDLRPIVNASGQTQTVDGILVGEYQDPDFGKITARSFAGVYPTSNAVLPATAVFDSVTVQFRLNFNAYGFSGEKTQRFAVHEITGDTLTLFNGNRYYANSPGPAYGSTPLGEAVVTVHYDSLKKEATAAASEQDTIIAAGRLADEYGARVFQALKNGFASAAEHRLFKSQIKGLALVPGTEPGIVGANIVNNFGQLSRVTVHYHTLTDAGAVADTLIRTLGFEYASFVQLEADRTGTELAGLQPYASVEPVSSSRYIQSGVPVITKLDLAPFYVFADSVENILINEAEVVIENVSAPQGMDPHGSLLFRLMNNNSDQFLNNHIAADREIAADYFVLSSQSEYYYFAASDGSVPATVEYDEDESRYSGFLTLFAQSLFKNKNDQDGINENRISSLAVYPANPPASRSITRTLFDKSSVKLRITYTRANAVTP
jgi:hypothetical protein